MNLLKRLANGAMPGAAGFLVMTIQAEVAVGLNSGDGAILAIDTATMT